MSTILKESGIEAVEQHDREFWSEAAKAYGIDDVDVAVDIIVQPLEHEIWTLLEGVDGSEYSSLDVELNLSIGVEHLNKAVGLYEEAQSLAASFASVVLDYHSQKAALKVERRRLIVSSAYDQATAVLSKQEKINSSPEGAIKADAESARKVRDHDLALRDLAKDNLDLEEVALDRARRLSMMPGHALNLRDRYDSAKNSFELAIAEAYRRFSAVERGFPVVFRPEQPLDALPSEKNIGLLDLLVIWAQDTVNRLDGETAFEVDFYATMGLLHNFSAATDGDRAYDGVDNNGWFNLLPEGGFEQEIARGVLRVRLNDWLASLPYKRVRLRGIDVEVEQPTMWPTKPRDSHPNVASYDDGKARFDHWDIEIDFPEQTLLPDAERSRLGPVRTTATFPASNGGKYLTKGVQNIDLNVDRSGKWLVIRISDRSSIATNRNNRAYMPSGTNHDRISNVFLKVWMTGLPKTEE